MVFFRGVVQWLECRSVTAKAAGSNPVTPVFKIMIQVQTLLRIADNSGAKVVKCIKVLNKSSNNRKDYAGIGDSILVSVRSLRSINSISKKKIKKGEIYKAIVVRKKKSIQRKTGQSLSFDDNEVVLVNSQDNLIGTRVFGPLTREIRLLNYRKLLSKSKKTI